jgi:hypothetical protein
MRLMSGAKERSAGQTEEKVKEEEGRLHGL